MIYMESCPILALSFLRVGMVMARIAAKVIKCSDRCTVIISILIYLLYLCYFIYFILKRRQERPRGHVTKKGVVQ